MPENFIIEIQKSLLKITEDVSFLVSDCKRNAKDIEEIKKKLNIYNNHKQCKKAK
ncbi:MAG: hypothetical protein ACRC0A_07760 [Chitinophagaceae bacterium]